MAKLEEQLEISELQAGGGSRKARKLERARDLKESAEKYKEAGFDPVAAESMAKREQEAGDRRENPRRIRGAGANGPAPERVSALDYLHDGKKMQGPQTSALDDYERRRSVPGVGGQIDKNHAEKEAAAAKAKAPAVADKPDMRVVNVLQDILKAIKEQVSHPPTS
jgi:hypothetical protein